MRKKVRQEYRLLTADSSEYYFEAVFILAMQNTFCLAYMLSSETDFGLVFSNCKGVTDKGCKDFHRITKQADGERVDQFAVDLCIMFTVLVLHFSCVQTVRNGMNMCKFVCFHPSEFDEPGWAFLLGVAVMWTTVNCELVNIVNALHQETLSEVITRFIAFKVLITV